MIYFDNNATTPVDPSVLEVMQPFLTTFYGNPSSLHRHGRAVKTAVDQARQHVANLVGVTASQVMFTSGGTEANNLALSAATKLSKKHILVGSTEHPSVLEPVRHFKNVGHECEELAVDSNGLISIESLKSAITNDTGLISVMHANNETGVIQNISALAEVAEDNGIVFHTDAIQSVGKMTVNFNQLNVSLMSLSAHKLYGPKGVGALIVDNKTDVTPLLLGGGQEFGFRPGTENVPGIIGFGRAAQLAQEQNSERVEHLLALRNRLEAGISSINGLTVVAQGVERLPNTCQILMDNVDGEMLLMQLDQKGVAVSSGSACSSNSKKPSSVLKAMGYTDKLALSAIRVSLGQQNTLADTAEFISTLKAIVNH